MAKTGKRPRTSAASFDESRFVSKEAFERYTTKYSKKKCILEKGLDPTGTSMEEQVRSRGWADFIKTPPPAVVSIVQEFYANAKEKTRDGVFVRGTRVPFNDQVINDMYNLPCIDESIYRKFCFDQKLPEVVSYLTDDTTQWTMTRKGYSSFPAGGLEHEKRAWHNFISSRLLPTLHVSQVNRKRAHLNYAINMGCPINVGQIIEDSITSIIDGSTTGALCHPSLIFALCVKAGVSVEASEGVCLLGPEINRSCIESYTRTITWSQQEQPTSPSNSSPADEPTSIIELLTQMRTEQQARHKETMA